MNVKLSLIPEDFLERITKNPNSIFDDFEIRLAVDVLRIYARDGIQSESKSARELLKKANLSNYIDKQSQHRKTDDPNLRYWQVNVPIFLQAISEVKNQAESIWKKHRRKYTYGKEEVIKEILTELLLGDIPSQDLIDRVGNLDGDRDKHLINLSLSIFAETQGISYSSVRRFYYSKDIQEKRKKLEILEEQYKQGQVKMENLNGQEIPDFSDEEISNNPELGIQIYKQAYIRYVRNRLGKTKNISANFLMDLLSLANE